MAKSSRASSRKANNQRLKKNVFGPVETARTERLSAKLLELASQAKREPERKDEDMEVDDAQGKVPSGEANADENSMDVDSVSKRSMARQERSKRIEKRRKSKSSIVFPTSKQKKRRSGKK